jgi:hypothetical protein
MTVVSVFPGLHYDQNPLLLVVGDRWSKQGKAVFMTEGAPQGQARMHRYHTVPHIIRHYLS